MVSKIDYDSVKLQSHLKYVIKSTSQKFSIFKILPLQNPGCALYTPVCPLSKPNTKNEIHQYKVRCYIIFKEQFFNKRVIFVRNL